MKATIIINSQADITRAIYILEEKTPIDPPHEMTIKPAKSIRYTTQNSKMWATLADIANQVVWHGNKLTKEEWKDVLTAGLKSQKVVPGIEGGFVVIGARTSKMSVAEMSELIELAMHFGDSQGVMWSAPDWYEETY